VTRRRRRARPDARRRGWIRVPVAVVIVLTLTMSSPIAAMAAVATAHRASLIAIENDLMCVACHESLAVAQSPEAYSERDYIRTLILQGETKRQIERNMVAQYGTSVLALPPAHGFNLLVYVVPPALVGLGIVTILITLPRWRRRSRLAATQPLPLGPALDPVDARRLNEDLGRYT
jgi:cytochrome c-type biogenesis protein CcmH/NrfF